MAAAAPLAISASFVNSSRPLSASFLPDRSYVLSIAALPSYYAAAASAPSNTIHLFDRSNCQTIVRALPGHADGITYMRTVSSLNDARDVLLSSGKDGIVKTWDERTGSVTIQMQRSGRRTPLLCCDASPDGFLVAAGSALEGEESSISYWDPRNPAAPLRQHTSTHADDITAVHFSQQGSAAVLLSASTDGLICTSNPHEEDEDESTISIANWGCSVSKAGWLPRSQGSEGPSIWAVSDMETLSFWSSELDLHRQIDREGFRHPNPAIPWTTDYIIDCHSLRNGSFHIFTGSNEGDIALISPHEVDDRWSLEQLYTSGHTEIVRCAYWDETAGLLLTGGEDAKLNVWSSPVHSSDVLGTNENTSMDVDSPRKRGLDDDEENEQKRVRTG